MPSAAASAPASRPAEALVAVDAQPDQRRHRAADLSGFLVGEIAQVHHLHLTRGVLVHRERVDHPDGVVRSQPFQLRSDLSVEVRGPEAQHYELDGSDCHIKPSLHSRQSSGPVAARPSGPSVRLTRPPRLTPLGWSR